MSQDKARAEKLQDAKGITTRKYTSATTAELIGTDIFCERYQPKGYLDGFTTITPVNNNKFTAE